MVGVILLLPDVDLPRVRQRAAPVPDSNGARAMFAVASMAERRVRRRCAHESGWGNGSARGEVPRAWT